MGVRSVLVILKWITLILKHGDSLGNEKKLLFLLNFVWGIMRGKYNFMMWLVYCKCGLTGWQMLPWEHMQIYGPVQLVLFRYTHGQLSLQKEKNGTSEKLFKEWLSLF